MNDKSIQDSLNSGDLSAITTYQAGVMQAASHRSLQKHCDSILKQYGISKMQWLLIGTVRDSGEKGMRLTDLSEAISTTLPFVTTAVNILESKGMLMRKDNGEDSRSKLISINQFFAPKCAEIEETLRAGLRKSIYARVDPAQFRTYMKVMYQLAHVDDKPSK
jgi:DNA-binding MarR family transcriptional regulator